MRSYQTVSKRDAVRDEIEGAIAILALRKNILAAELLAQAANEVMLGIAKKNNVETINRSFYDNYIKSEHVGDAKRHIKSTYNFLKHADRDADSSIDKYNIERTLWQIFMAEADYGIIFRQRSLMMLMYETWFSSRYPDVLKYDRRDALKNFDARFGSMASISCSLALTKLEEFFAEFLDAERYALAYPDNLPCSYIEC